jgi:hypothetical protein
MRVGMKGGEGLSKESDEWAEKLATALRRAIGDAGAELSGDLSSSALTNSEDTRQSVVRLRQAYENISVQMYKKRGDVHKGRYTLGDEVSILPCAGQADSLAFISGAGVMQTGSRKTLSILTGGVFGVFAAMSKYEIWVAFANARTGVVTTLLHVSSMGGKMGKDPEAALNRALVSQFKRLHFGATTIP